MNAHEANELLTALAVIDPRTRAASAHEQVTRARMWARLLPEVVLTAAFGAVEAHYREETRVVMPADVLRRCTPSRPRLSADSEARAEWLAAHGLTEEQLARIPTEQLRALVAMSERIEEVECVEG